MDEIKESKIWKLRTVKDYPQAHNHLFIGSAIQINQSYVRLHCRTYHFGKIINSIKDIRQGILGVRVLPWNRIELINELPATFDYKQAELTAGENGKIALSDGKIDCVLSSSYDNRY